MGNIRDRTIRRMGAKVTVQYPIAYLRIRTAKNWHLLTVVASKTAVEGERV